MCPFDDCSGRLCDTDLLACSAAAHMDIDNRYNDGPVQVASSRPEETGLSDPAAFIQDLANKVRRSFDPLIHLTMSPKPR